MKSASSVPLKDHGEDLAAMIAARLGETGQSPRSQIVRILEHLGAELVIELLEETWRIEQQGGMLILNGSRRRTPGGVFFHLVRERLIADGRAAELAWLFPTRSRAALPPRTNQMTAPSVTPPRLRPRRRARALPPGLTLPETEADDVSLVQPGLVVLLDSPNDTPQVALCCEVMGERVWVCPADAATQREYQRRDVCAVVGQWTTQDVTIDEETHNALSTLVHAAIQWQSHHPFDMVAQAMHPEQAYCLDDLAAQLGIAADDLVGRLGLALTLHTHRSLFMPRTDHGSLFESWYMVHHGWEQMLTGDVRRVRPDQAWIQSVIERHLGMAPELYRRSVNPDTGAITLSFHFPDVARVRYATAIDAIATETGMNITIHAQPHQEMMIQAARTLLPDQHLITHTSVYQHELCVRVRYRGYLDEQTIEGIQSRFQEISGWRLEIVHVAEE